MAGNIKGITIQIGGDTTKLGDALASAERSLKSTQRSLNDVNKALRFDPGNVDLLKDKQRMLGEKIQTTKDKLESLNKAQKELDARGVDKNSREYQKLQTQITLTKGKLDGLNKEMKTFGSVGGQHLKVVGEKVKAIGGKFKAVGKDLSTHVTAPIVGIGAASAAAWKEVEEGEQSVITKTGASGEALDDMKERMKHIAETAPTSFQAAGDAIGEVNTRFGVTGDELEKLSLQYLKFAKINGEDVTTSIDSTQAAMAAFNVPAGQASMALDTLTLQSQATGVSTTKLAQDITANAAAMKDMGFEFQDAANLIASLNKSGVDTSTVMTGMKAAFKNAAKEGKSSKDVMAEFEQVMKSNADSSSKSQKAIEVFGAKAGPAIAQAVGEGKVSFTEFGETMEAFEGTVDSTFSKTKHPVDDIKVAMNNLKSAGAELFVSFQTVAAPALKDLASAAKNLSEHFKKLSPAQQEMIVKVGLIVAAIGPLVMLIGNLITAAGAIIGALPAVGAAFAAISGPIGLVVLGITAAIAAGVALYKNWDKIKAGAKALRDNIGQKWNDLKQKTHEAFENMKSTASEKWTALKNNVASTPIGQAVGTIWSAAKKTMIGNLAAMKQAYDSHGGGMKGAVAATMAGIKGHFTSGYGFLNNLTGGKLGEMANKARSHFGQMASSAGQKMSEIKNHIGNNLASGVNSGINTIGRFADGVRSKIDAARNFVRSGIDAMRGIFQGVHFELPKIALPHFSVNPKGWEIGDLLKGSIPSLGIEWYDRGGIFSAPTVIGVGEKRPEFVGALDDLRGIVREESSGANGVLLGQIVSLLMQLVRQISDTNRTLVTAGGPTYNVTVDGITINDLEQVDSRIVDFVNDLIRKGRMY